MTKVLILFCFIINIIYLMYSLYNTNENLMIKEKWERLITILFIFFNIIALLFVVSSNYKAVDIIHHVVFRLFYYVFAVLFTSPLLLINSIIVLSSTLLSWGVFKNRCIFDIFTKYTESKMISFDKKYLFVYIIILLFKLHNIQSVFITGPFFIINILLFIQFIYYESKYFL